uniref:Putative leucine-rich repeat receptor-like protein kinase At5g49770 isoform X2 n=1 Tax=Rhizophora mucronata TaxID=61149 RepID=A0A2P2LPU3_RHIMU
MPVCPDRLPLRVPFGTKSYTSICSPRSKQNPRRFTRFL